MTCDYQPGHPHGFHNHIYLAEVHLCRVLHDPADTLAPLKALTTPYPPLLRRALIRTCLWEAGFSLGIAGKPAARGDAPYVAGSLCRCAARLVQALFPLNERYFVNEKGSVAAIDSFPLRPEGFGEIASARAGAARRQPGAVA